MKAVSLMMSLRIFSNEGAASADFFQPKKKVNKMKSKELNKQNQDIQTNNDNKKGENDMTEQLEQAIETTELGNDETKESIDQSTEVTEEVDIITDVDDAAATLLPEGVTAEPRNEEEMHLKHIREWPNAVKVYLKVSDDVGGVLGSKTLERQVKAFCDQHAGPKAEIKDPAKVIEEARELATKYALQINMVESGLSGIITKYRIRQGDLFNILKNAVKATKGPKWMEWFKGNFDGREFRTAQDYMRLAKIPGIIRYAVFGKERLLQILRQLSAKEKLATDPLGSFIERTGVDFNPAEEVDVQELKIEADIAINLQKLIGGGITEITKDKVEALVRNGREVESAHIRELKVAKEAGLNVVARFEEILASDSRIEPVMTPTRKAEGFKKTTDRFIKAMESALEDADYLGQVNAELITSLREKLQQLEQLIPTTT